MLPISVTQYQQRLDNALAYVGPQANACPLNMQHVYSSYLVVKVAGMVEIALRDILGEYARQHGNIELQRYTSTAVERENSLNCEKIEKLLSRFSPTWWTELVDLIPEPQRSAVDSVKTLRDQFAHGKHNGTGYATIEGYYQLSKDFVRAVADYVNP